MSQVCVAGSITPSPCQIDSFGNFSCQALQPNQTGLVLENSTQEAILGFNYTDSSSCFTLPASASTQAGAVYSIAINSAQPTTFALYGANTGLSYQSVTSQAQLPTKPTIVAQNVTPSVNPNDLPAGWQYPDIRKKKPIWLLAVGAGILAIAAIIMIVVGARKNSLVRDIYATLKGSKDDRDKEILVEDESLKEEYDKFNSTGLIVAGSFLLVIIVGLTIAIMFLPGYPLSKYLSYSQCQQIAQQDPNNQWSWSLPPQSGFWSFVCRALNACICRSYVLERDCLLYKIINTDYMPYPWQSALKNPPIGRQCLCCVGQMCGTVIDGQITACSNTG